MYVVYCCATGEAREDWRVATRQEALALIKELEEVSFFDYAYRYEN